MVLLKTAYKKLPKDKKLLTNKLYLYCIICIMKTSTHKSDRNTLIYVQTNLKKLALFRIALYY